MPVTKNFRRELLSSARKLVSAFILSLTLPASGAYAEEVKAVDLIIHGRYVVTMAQDAPVIEHGAVAVRDGIIVAVGSDREIAEAFTAEKHIAGKDRILLPGLVNGHTHTAMVLFRGMADDLMLMEWLQDYIFPMEGQFVDPEFIEVGMNLACLEMIRGGTTTFVDMYFYPGKGADVIEACGLRAIMGSPSIDFPSPGFTGWDDSFAAAVTFVKDRKSPSGRITPAFAPHAPYTVSPEHLTQVAEMARELKAPITIHLSEDRAELVQIMDRYQTTPIRHVEGLGLLDNRVIAAHVVHPTAEEIKLLAKYKIGVIHNPTSNLKTAAGVSPVPEMLKQGVLVGLGTDGAVSNNDLDMWEEIRMAALIHKGVGYDATVMPAKTVLDMATRGGAEAIGLGDQVGELVVGKRADLIQVDLSGPHMTPLYDVISHLVYAVKGSDVVTTIVDGHVLMEDGKVLTLDAEDIRRKANEIAARIAEALNKK
ncbi:MAG: 5-methylthioadenosine deaminase [Alphaproteobacteria bacterium]|nr:MAG: 5-methylthioadenosine deaminase [Alphaproteobacteria bacterium]